MDLTDDAQSAVTGLKTNQPSPDDMEDYQSLFTNLAGHVASPGGIISHEGTAIPTMMPRGVSNSVSNLLLGVFQQHHDVLLSAILACMAGDGLPNNVNVVMPDALSRLANPPMLV